RGGHRRGEWLPVGQVRQCHTIREQMALVAPAVRGGEARQRDRQQRRHDQPYHSTPPTSRKHEVPFLALANPSLRRSSAQPPCASRRRTGACVRTITAETRGLLSTVEARPYMPLTELALSLTMRRGMGFSVRDPYSPRGACDRGDSRATGSVKLMTVPCRAVRAAPVSVPPPARIAAQSDAGGGDTAQMRPPCASTMPRAIASPSPAPLGGAARPS